MARAMWKGSIKLGSQEVPVKLYSAVQEQGVHFRLLDAKNKEPVKQQMVDSSTGKVVESGDIRRAVEIGTGELVILDDEELAELEPEGSRDIEVTRFLKSGSISHEWYDRPYFLGPDEDEERYFALVEALRKTDREGVVKWVMRKKDYVGALRAEGDYLTLSTLRHAGEVVTAASLDPPSGRDLAQRELDMARQLIEAMEDDLDLAAFHDEYRERVLELVEAKRAGKVVKFPKAPSRKVEKDLEDVLAKSLAALKKEKASA